MGQAHHHPHQHVSPSPQLVDSDVPSEVSRRNLLRRAGLLGATAAASSAFAGAQSASASPSDESVATDRHGHERTRSAGYQWLAGDHHVHTQYSNDGLYRVTDQVAHASAFGLDWMVITDHGGERHSKIGVEKVNPDIRAAREGFGDLLIFQGVEWNIPAAEHGTVFVHPGDNEVAVLRDFESRYDGAVTTTTASTEANEAHAIAGLTYLAEAVTAKRVSDAIFFANHPARKGLDSPHEIRAWRESQPTIAVGMEGAPGHQAAGIAAPNGPGGGRGHYANDPTSSSFAAYPAESYRTFGGFDWMTATVGGLWDSLLAEGKPWWITANSDSHSVYTEGSVHGTGTDFDTNGFHADPVYGSPLNVENADFWPGYFSRTHVGASDFSYASVMSGLRAGRIWVDHGGLIQGLQVSARTSGSSGGATLGETLWVKRGAAVELVITVELAGSPNWAQFIPTLARIDVIAGEVTGIASDKDTFTAPQTRVMKSFEVNRSSGTFTVTYKAPAADRPRYYRIRGTDGKRSAVGLLGASIDPSGPAMDLLGSADPWQDLWFYANPIWVIPRD